MSPRYLVSRSSLTICPAIFWCTTATSMSHVVRPSGLGLRVELLVDLLRAGVARTRAGRLDAHARVLRLEARGQELVDVVDHVLVAGREDVERRVRGPRRRPGQEAEGRRRQQQASRDLPHLFPPHA